MKNFLSVFCALSVINCFLVPTLWATTVSTPAQLLNAAISSAIDRYFKDGGSEQKLSYGNISTHANTDVLEEIAGMPVTSRITFLNTPVSIITDKGKLIAFTTDVIIEDRRASEGRYVIWLDGEEVKSEWEPLKDIDDLLAANGITMSKTRLWRQPDTLHLGGEGTPPANLKGQPIPKQTPQDLAPPNRVDSPPVFKPHETKPMRETPVVNKDKTATTTQVAEGKSAQKRPLVLYIVVAFVVVALAWLLLKKWK